MFFWHNWVFSWHFHRTHSYDTSISLMSAKGWFRVLQCVGKKVCLCQPAQWSIYCLCLLSLNQSLQLFTFTFLFRIPNNWVSFTHNVPSLFTPFLRWFMDVPHGTAYILDPVDVLCWYTSIVKTSLLFLLLKRYQSLRLLLFHELLYPKLLSN